MRAGSIIDLKGNFGTIKHDFIWEWVAEYGMDQLVLPSTQVTPEDLDYIRGRGLHVGVNFSPKWYGDCAGPLLAEIASRKLDELGYGNKVCTVFLDNENHGSSDVLNMLAHWRTLRPTRDTVWSPEPLQGGDMNADLRQMILHDAHLRVAAQLYRGKPEMAPVSERAVHDDIAFIPGMKRLSVYGVVSQTSPVKVKHAIPEGWNGILYALDYLIGL